MTRENLAHYGKDITVYYDGMMDTYTMGYPETAAVHIVQMDR